ncbi:MAG: MEDS domain-containing protein [Pseudonocardiaceae bacterium]
MTETAQGFGFHDHVCWAFDEPGEFHSPVMKFLTDGLAQGQRVCYITSGDTKQWSKRLRSIDKHNGFGRKDATQLLRLDEFYPGQMAAPVRHMEAFAAATEDALAAGFTGLRVAADATPLVRTSAQRDVFARLDYLFDQYMIRRPLTGLCGFNRTELGQEAIAELACLHPTVHGVPPPFRLHASTDGAAAALSGELDATSLRLFPMALRWADPRPTDGELVIDATELTFIDHRSLLALADHARHWDATAVLLANLPGVARVIDIIDLDEVRVQVPT